MAPPIIGCATAGEISPDGSVEGEIMAIALPAQHFIVDQILIPGLDMLNEDKLVGTVFRSHMKRGHQRPDWSGDVAFLSKACRSARMN